VQWKIRQAAKAPDSARTGLEVIDLLEISSTRPWHHPNIRQRSKTPIKTGLSRILAYAGVRPSLLVSGEFS
jgi:hypothetical protein